MSLIARASQSPIVPATARFVRWWIGELAEMAQGLGARKAAPKGMARILIEPNRVIVERVRGDLGERFVDERSFDKLDDEALIELAGLITGARTQLCLQVPDIFVTQVKVPMAARSRIEAAVGLQMSEIAPLRPELLMWAILDREIQDKAIILRVAMARRARIAVIKARFERLELDPPVICATHDGRDIPLERAETGGFSFDIARHKLRLASALLLLSIPLTILTGSTILAARARWAAEAIEGQVRDVRQAQHRAQRLEQQRELLSPLAGQPGASALLNDLAKRLPHDDWLQSIDRKPDGSLSFIAVTRDEAVLDAAVRASDLLPGARVTDRSQLDDGSVEVTYGADAP